MKTNIMAMVIAAVIGQAWAQCSKDTDCKGNRICVQGTCVNAPASVHNCGKDAECSGDSICKNGQCAPPEAAAPAPVQAPAAQVSQQALETRQAPKGLMSRNFEVGITTAIWFSGTVDYKNVYSAYDPEKATGFLLRVFLDGYVVDKLAVGAYLNFSPVSWNNYTSTSTMLEEGVSLKARFPISDGVAAVKPGISIGHRGFSSDNPSADKIDALGVNLSCEVQFYIHSICVPYVEISFLAQPSGSNDYDPAITFPPIFYVGGGISF